MSHELVGMKKVVFVVLATLWLFACKKEDGKKVEFHALPVSSIVSDTLEIDSVRMNTFFSNPTALFKTVFRSVEQPKTTRNIQT